MQNLKHYTSSNNISINFHFPPVLLETNNKQIVFQSNLFQ